MIRYVKLAMLNKLFLGGNPSVYILHFALLVCFSLVLLVFGFCFDVDVSFVHFHQMVCLDEYSSFMSMILDVFYLVY